MKIEFTLKKLVEVGREHKIHWSSPALTSFYPPQFYDLLKACHAKPPDRTPFGATADWCDENDEPELAQGFRLIHDNPNWFVGTIDGDWVVSGGVTGRIVVGTAGIAALALAVRDRREAIRKELGL